MKADSITLRRAVGGDAVAIASLHDDIFGGRWKPDAIEKFVTAPNAVAHVAEGPDGALSGFLISTRAADELEILSIGVARHWQRRGIARRLLDAAHDAAMAAGAAHAVLEVAVDNDAAKAFYAAAGFAQVGHRPDYYARPNGERQHALILRKPLRGA